jgi:hypothetical protein
MLARLAALFLGVIPIAAPAVEGADKMAVKSIESFCELGGDSSIPIVIDHLQHLTDLLPSIPPEEKKAEDERLKRSFWEGDIPPPRPAPVEADLQQVNKEQYRWRYNDLARVLGSLRTAQAAVGYILLDPKASREYEAAGHLVASPGEHQIGWEYQNPDAEKLYRATFAADSLGSMEAALQKFIGEEEARGEEALITEPRRNELTGYAGGFAAGMANYIRCKLIKVAATTARPER